MTSFPTLVPARSTETGGWSASHDAPGADGTALLAVPRSGGQLLLLTGIERGIGSSGLWLDRGQPGDVRLVHLRVVGDRVLLVQDNKHFTVVSDDPAAVQAGDDSFARSVLWSAPVVEHRGDGTVVVDAASLATSDLLAVSARLARAKQGDLRLDAARSYLVSATTGPGGPTTAGGTSGARSTSAAGSTSGDSEPARTPGSVELSAVLTFAGRGEGALLAQVSPDPDAVSITQRVSLVPLPEGYAPRTFHPGAGGYGKGFADHALPGGRSVDVRVQPRFRLDKTTPGTAPSTVHDPIVFHVDPAIPEPYRSAVIEGGSWWAEGFEAAGFVDAYRVEVRGEDVDPFAARTSSLWWVHRTNRGWSQGAALTDPRTGEILSGRVRLGSQRIHQLTLIAEALLAPYGHVDEARRLAAVEELVLARLRQLAAHEIGHALGFMHNYASHQHPQASVMDYPHPRVRLGDDGEVDVSDAYPVGLGPWDVFAVRHAYQDFAPGEEAAGLESLRREATAAGLTYLTDDDGHHAEAASPDAVPWVHGAEPVGSLENLLQVRAKALRAFSPGVVAPDRQAGEIEERLVPLYLLHRYQVPAVARLLGGVEYAYTLAGEAATGNRVVPGSEQRRALSVLTDLLSPQVLALPSSVLRTVVPPAIRYERTAEYLTPRRGLVFDPFTAVGAGAGLVAEQLFAPGRLNRVAWQAAEGTSAQGGSGQGTAAGSAAAGGADDVPTVAEVVATVLDAAWDAPGTGDALTEAVRQATAWTVLQHLVATLAGGGLHLPVAATVTTSLADAVDRLEDRLDAAPEAAGSGAAGAGSAGWATDRGWDHLVRTARLAATDASAVDLGPLPVIPPGAPI
ncbi:Matrixin [Sanguibacter keddieii DSM 10542]|uniref:Matrixin n=1 Tax=Sanguibacter keddieii (strain ATCC 51767 / DSM 10542 / NCFB 3025 / ST-74) TaxID=446469 RepID=D1BEP4_SANKS|nr:zinc-dependent metalloprotease [Sanguibacter keddieii]ACZ23330.1 Matrixin [Sanguibacter keddieii DSM 10542]